MRRILIVHSQVVNFYLLRETFLRKIILVCMAKGTINLNVALVQMQQRTGGLVVIYEQLTTICVTTPYIAYSLAHIIVFSLVFCDLVS